MLIPQSQSVLVFEPVHARGIPAGRVHQMLRAARTVAALAVPQADENHLRSAERAARFQHPEVIALVGIVARTEAARVRRARRATSLFALDGEIAVAPIGVGKIDRIGKKRRSRRTECTVRAAAPRARQASANSRSPPQAPPQIARSLELAATSGSSSSFAIASAATGSLLAGNRGFLRPGASIMWPLNSSTLRGGATAGSLELTSTSSGPVPISAQHTAG